MSRAGVICEFNPFHNGHKFLLQKIKNELADEAVCVMSGSFVQRGDIAITDKYSRAKAALENGADAVIELPTVYAVSAAGVFAENGVRLAAAMGCDTLCFGAESDIVTLKALADLLASEAVNARIRGFLSEGFYYPKALSLAAGMDFSGVIDQPNNILALEYIRACRKYGMKAAAIMRKGASHDGASVIGDIASASKLRELILGGADYSAYTPMNPAAPCKISSLGSAILYRLKTITPDEAAQLAGIDEGLENRLIRTAKDYNSVEEILSAVKTKRYTMARLRRIVIQALLGITSEMQNTPAPYLRALGFKAAAADIFREAELPLIIKTRADYEKLDNSAKEIFVVDLRAAEAMNIAKGGSPINEFSHPPVII